jgi:hypothetical protein
MSVYFYSSLLSGQRVFVMAEVGDSVELLHVMTSDDCEAIEIPVETLCPEDLFTLKIYAGIEYQERLFDVPEAC